MSVTHDEPRPAGGSLLRTVLDERLPAGTGWWFTLGSVLLFLLGLQAVTGIALALYYAPTPDHAYQSVRFIMRDVSLGWFVRGLHYFGASALVIAAALHMLRVIGFGSYKRPRQATWLSGLALLLLILAFSLTGYLLPWDQRAYWATVVTINIATLVPGAGDLLASLAGAPGGRIGALTLSRWYAIHVIVLPAILAALVAVHLFLMRRHGISGPVRARAGEPRPFYPDHAAKDVTVALLAGAVVATLAWTWPPALERVADPADASYVPRPEWYFLGLFQLLKFMPGRLELFGALVLPGLALTMLALLPWIDRGPLRDPRRRPLVVGGVAAGVVMLLALTLAGWRDRPATAAPDEWSVREIAGASLAAARGCDRCHGAGRVADPLGAVAVARPAAWIRHHVADPEVIAPGIRPAPDVDPHETDAIVAFARRGGRPPEMAAEATRTAVLLAQHCLRCHRLDGEGGSEGPDLSHAGRERDESWLRRWIARPEAVKPDADMPAFDRKLAAEDLDRLAAYLAARR